MLRRTFCHLRGIGTVSEQRLWSTGVRCWDDVAAAVLSPQRVQALRHGINQSQRRYDRGDARYFAQCLPAREQWRLFTEYRDRVAYLDIETTGLGGPDDYVTTIALYDGRDVRHYVQGENLEQFAEDARAYQLLVTYNGKSFDVPFIARFMGVQLDQAHIDLMHLLRGLGYRGGLKGVERQLGYDRPDMADIDGYFAVVLWREYQRTGDRRVLDTLLAYNVQDVLNLEPLMVFAFNRRLANTPFAEELRLPEPVTRANPFPVARDVVDRLQGRTVW